MKAIYIFLVLFIFYSCKKDNDPVPATNPIPNHSVRYELLTGHSWDFDSVVEVGPSISGYFSSPHVITFNINGILEWYPSSGIGRNWELNSSETIISVTIPQSQPNNQFWDIRSLTSNSLVIKMRNMNDSANTQSYMVYRYRPL